MKYYVLPLLYLLLLLNSCLKEGAELRLKSEALLVWTGDPAADARCGYFIKISDQEYKSENEAVLPEVLKTKETVPVMIVYTLVNKKLPYICSRGASGTAEGIRIYSIQRKQLLPLF